VAEAKLRALLDAGIRTFISLMEEDETDKTGDPFAPYEPTLHALAGEVDVTVHRSAIQDMGVSDTAHIRKILDTIAASIEKGHPVYLHC